MEDTRQWRVQGGGGAPGVQPPKPPKTEIKKKTNFVDITISKALRDLPFSPKSATEIS
jgi:hypothetical protein